MLTGPGIAWEVVVVGICLLICIQFEIIILPVARPPS